MGSQLVDFRPWLSDSVALRHMMWQELTGKKAAPVLVWGGGGRRADVSDKVPSSPWAPPLKSFTISQARGQVLYK